MNEEERRIQETGSNNISKASPEWARILKQAREEHARDCVFRSSCTYDIHHAYRLVNVQVQTGINWAKCINCGSPYRLDSSGASAETCSESCSMDMVDSLMREW